MRNSLFGKYNICIFVIVLCLSFTNIKAEQSVKDYSVRYKVGVENLNEQMYRIETTVSDVNKDQLKIFFPMYRPGIYTTYHYFKSVGDLEITDGKGKKLNYIMPSLQTFLINTKGVNEVKIKSI